MQNLFPVLQQSASVNDVDIMNYLKEPKQTTSVSTNKDILFKILQNEFKKMKPLDLNQ